ncbi:MAG: SufD family Fe-S cluster assembly protein [Lachnospiraceae bacterium]|nr:SufD family Fe-S cluster assembly protein [Lachnospiraceae bacterium]
MSAEITVNRMPRSTWNWLDVNEARMDALSFPGPGFDIPERFKDMGTGMGRGASELISLSCTEHRIVEVPEGEDLKEPVIIGGMLEDGEKQASVTLIHAGRNSRVKVLEFCESREGHSASRAELTYVMAEEGAHVTVLQAQMLSRGSFYISDTGMTAKEDATVELEQVFLGADHIYAGCETLLSGDRSSFKADTAYLGEGSRILDMNYVARHGGRKTDSRMNATGALLGKSDKIYRGTIDFLKGSSGSTGREDENVLLLSEDVRNRSVPVILCAEEDVDGQHAATIGRIDTDKLFYLMSRALSEEMAKRLVITSGFMPVIEAIPEVAVRNAAVNYLERRLTLD